MLNRRTLLGSLLAAAFAPFAKVLGKSEPPKFVGDAVTDNRASLQAVIDEGCGILPAGIYRTSSTLSGNHGVVLYGEGKCRTVIVRTYAK